MKIIIDIVFNHHIIDARLVKVKIPKSHHTPITLDLTTSINKQIAKAIRYEKMKKDTRKRLDKNEN